MVFDKNFYPTTMVVPFFCLTIRPVQIRRSCILMLLETLDLVLYLIGAMGNGHLVGCI